MACCDGVVGDNALAAGRSRRRVGVTRVQAETSHHQAGVAAWAEWRHGIYQRTRRAINDGTAALALPRA